MPTFVAPLLPPDLLVALPEGDDAPPPVSSLFAVGGAATSGESDPPSLWAKLDWFCVSWSAVPPLPELEPGPELELEGGAPCSLAMAAP